MVRLFGKRVTRMEEYWLQLVFLELEAEQLTVSRFLLVERFADAPMQELATTIQMQPTMTAHVKNCLAQDAWTSLLAIMMQRL